MRVPHVEEVTTQFDLHSLSDPNILGQPTGAGVGATLFYHNVALYISAAAGPVVDTLIVICLTTNALEQARKRSIRRTLESSFLNHHVHNAMTQQYQAMNWSIAYS